MKRPLGTQLGILALGVCLVVGCSSGGSHPTAKVRGKVTCKGQPVVDAMLTFSPQASQGQAMPGKPAVGRTDKDGVFVLSTYGDGDGAVVGKHRVSVASDDVKKPLPGKPPKDLILEVKQGDNDFPIDLTP